MIDEVPAKRLPIKNCVVDQRYRPKAYAFIEHEIREGHQAYVICPLVEESENMEAEMSPIMQNVCGKNCRKTL